MSCVSLVDVGVQMSTLFQFEVFPNPPSNGMQWKEIVGVMHIYINIEDKNTRDGVE